jgi:phosphopantothenoylcysteine decarboxylase / phosphopantothenate---cysteine ligase
MKSLMVPSATPQLSDRFVARILLTSGPTRQYLDPVRYLTNASSGRMGAALAQSIIRSGHEVIIISGPVSVTYPQPAHVIWVTTTDEMLLAAQNAFTNCDGAIGAAAPCDYMPRHIQTQKIAKDGEPLRIELIETPDVVATLGQMKTKQQWVVGFALETEDRRFRATVKLEKKHCDLIVSNGPSAIDSDSNSIEIINRNGHVLHTFDGTKSAVADCIIGCIEEALIQKK